MDYNAPVTPQEIERRLANLSTEGTRVTPAYLHFPGREVWRIDLGGKPYHVHFYPREKQSRLSGGGVAMREFVALQKLQQAKVPAPRVIANLSGFRLDALIGDATIVEPLDGAAPAADALSVATPRHHYRIATALAAVVDGARRAKLTGLSLDALAVKPDGTAFVGEALLLKEAIATVAEALLVKAGGVTVAGALAAAAAMPQAVTRTDRLRLWRALAPQTRPPRLPVGVADREPERRLQLDGWHVAFDPGAMEEKDARREFPRLLELVAADQLEILKREANGDVLAGEVVLAGRPVPVVVKRPRRKRVGRGLLEVGRFAKARRTWIKAWKLAARGIDAERPLLLAEKKVGPYVRDALLVFTRVPGVVLAKADLDAMTPRHRDGLFHRIGAVLRRLDDLGFAHFDAKSWNWIVTTDSNGVPRPVMIDVDGVRHYRWRAFGVRRFARSLKEHPQHTPADLDAAARGYAPWTKTAERLKLCGVTE